MAVFVGDEREAIGRGEHGEVLGQSGRLPQEPFRILSQSLTLAGAPKRAEVGQQGVFVLGDERARLQALDVRYERGVVPIYYVTDSDEGREVPRCVLEEFPAQTGQASGERGSATLDFLLFGAQLIRDGVVKFADWSRRMLARFGEAVRRDLVRLYYQAKAVASNIFRDERGSLSGREIGPHGPIFREFYHDAKGAIAKLRELETGEAVAALWHPEVGDIDLIWGEPGSTPRKGYGLAKLVKWHAKEGVLDDLQGLISSMRAERDNPKKWNENTIQLENDTHAVVLRRNWKGTPRQPWVLTAYRDKAKAAPSAGRTIDIPGTREEDWPSPPLGDAASTSIIEWKARF